MKVFHDELSVRFMLFDRGIAENSTHGPNIGVDVNLRLVNMRLPRDGHVLILLAV
jgi:hypothetical protein